MRTPKAMAESISAAANTVATMAVENGTTVPSYKIKHLCKDLKPMKEMEWGASVGKEII